MVVCATLNLWPLLVLLWEYLQQKQQPQDSDKETHEQLEDGPAKSRVEADAEDEPWRGDGTQLPDRKGQQAHSASESCDPNIASACAEDTGSDTTPGNCILVWM